MFYVCFKLAVAGIKGNEMGQWGNSEEKQRQEGRCVTNVVKLEGSGSRTRKRRKELTQGLPSFELRRGLPESREQVFFFSSSTMAGRQRNAIGVSKQ